MKCCGTVVLVCLPFVVAIGCNRVTPAPASNGPPQVEVANPVPLEVRNYEDFTGRTQAVKRADLQARVGGYLEFVYVGKDANAPEGSKIIEEGGDVKKGDILFVIQQKPFKDALDQAQNSLAQLKSQRDFNYRELERLKSAKTGVTPSDLDKARSTYDTSESAVKEAENKVSLAQQNLDWSTVRAPFDGRISKRFVDVGADIKPDNTILATFEQIHPLYAYFDVDERTLLRIRDRLPDGKVPADAAKQFPLKMGLTDEKVEDFSHTGVLEIVDNHVDPGTGTVRMWGIFENPRHDYRSGLFVRVHMGIGELHREYFVTEAALGSDQGRKFLLVVGKDNIVERRYVQVGQRDSGLIAVKGVEESDQVVVKGLQVVRAKMEVVPRSVSMRSLATKSSADQSSGGK